MFGIEIVCYLFLGGAGAGALLVLAILGLLVPTPCLHTAAMAHRTPFAAGHAVVGVALLAGCVLLMCDLGRLDRLAVLLTAPTPSPIAVGAYALAAAVLLDGVLLALWSGAPRRRPAALVRLADILAAGCALAAMAYTGLLLAGMRAVPLWASGWLPVLFVASALSCGLATVSAVFVFTGADLAFPRAIRGMAAVDLLAVALEAVSAALVVGAAAEGAPFAALLDTGFAADPAGTLAAAGAPDESATALAGALSTYSLLAGENAPLFWGGFVTIGLIMPLALNLVQLRAHRHLPLAALACSACVLAGGLALRLVIVAAGMHPPLL